MSIVVVAKKSDLADLVMKALEGSRVFSASNTVTDGTERTWNIHPRAGYKHIKGTGKPLDPSLNMVRVYDMTRAVERGGKGQFIASDANAWRTLRLTTLTKVKVDGVTYTLA